MSTLKELTAVLDYYLKDYAHPVDWPKFRVALREINVVLKGLEKPDDDLVEHIITTIIYSHPGENFDYNNCRKEITRLLQSRQPGITKAVNIIFDGPPSAKSGRFVEVELDNGKSINAGEWIKQKDGHWALRITELPKEDK